MMTHEAHCYCLLVSKVRRLSLSFELLHFDRIAGRMRPSRIRGEGITAVAGPEFQPEAIADRRCGMHDAIVADSPYSNNKGDRDSGDNAAKQPAAADAFNFPKSRQKKKGKHGENGGIGESRESVKNAEAEPYQETLLQVKPLCEVKAGCK